MITVPMFVSGQITRDELERIIRDVVCDESDNVEVLELEYTTSGVNVTTTNDKIEIQIDWNELVLVD